MGKIIVLLLSVIAMALSFKAAEYLFANSMKRLALRKK